MLCCAVARRDRDGFLAEAEHLLPIHNYQSSDSSSSSSKGASAQQLAAGVMPSQGIGSLEGFAARGMGQQQQGLQQQSPVGAAAGGESLAQWQARHSVRVSPRLQDTQQQQQQPQQPQQKSQQQQEQGQQSKQQQSKGWEDDDRFSWD
jgi:hypothetical protein